MPTTSLDAVRALSPRLTPEFLEEHGHTRLILTHEKIVDLALWHKHRAGWIDACERMERIL